MSCKWNIRRLFSTGILVLAIAQLGSSTSVGQSFACTSARTADEAMICQIDTLARLDLRLGAVYADAAARMSGSEKLSLASEQKDWLQARRRCGMDVPCIRHAYEQRIAQLSASSPSPESRPEKATKISVGAHAGDATILSITGADSDNAVALFRRELDDLIEDCTRNTGQNADGGVDAKKISECAKQGMRREAGAVYKRRALCSKSTVYTEFGNFSMVNTEKEPESQINGKIYRPIRTDWKNHRNEEIVGNCSGCNTAQMIDTFKVLCPKSYAAYFDGYEPY